MPDDPVTPTQDTIVWLRDGTPQDVTGRRRLTGLTVIAVAVIAMMLLTAGRARQVSGVAVVPPPPQIGDCVSIPVTDQIVEQMNEGEVPVLVSGPCEGARAGEVASLEDQRAYAQRDCWTPTLGYLGVPATAGPFPESESETAWQTRTAAMSYTFGPSPLQVAAGQLWSACVLVGLDTENFRPRPLIESARDAATRGGTAFNPFAICSDAPLSTEFTPCGGPHRYEMVADGFNLGPSEADSLESCRALVSELTGLQDPSANGRLRVELIAYRYDDGGGSLRETDYQQARTAGGGVTCTVSPVARDEALTMTLVGLGERPLPIG